MKTLIQKAAIVLAVAMVAQAKAQAEEQTTSRTKNQASPSLALVPMIGVTSFKLVNSDMDLSSRGGISAGVMADVATPVEGLVFESGLDYFEAGGKTDTLFTSSEVQLGYLSIPLKAKYGFYNSGAYNFYGKGGMSVAFLMAATAKNSDIFGTSTEQDLKDQTNKIDYLGTLALGGDMEAMGGRVNLELEYAKGTQKTFKAQNDKIEGYILRLGYTISI